MLLVGLTGGIGAGKSTVSSLLAELGACIVDADEVPVSCNRLVPRCSLRWLTFRQLDSAR